MTLTEYNRFSLLEYETVLTYRALTQVRAAFCLSYGTDKLSSYVACLTLRLASQIVWC